MTTVDAMQGREADVVILSCVRSGEAKTLGFLTCINRLNVAISRAREVLYIVGHRDALNDYGNIEWNSLLAHKNVNFHTSVPSSESESESESTIAATSESESESSRPSLLHPESKSRSTIAATG